MKPLLLCTFGLILFGCDAMLVSGDDAGTDAEGPDTSPADAVIPDAVIPDAVIPDAVIPDAVIPDATNDTIPDAIIPDAIVPDAVVPDATVPDATVPDGNVPDATQPDANIPDATPDADAMDPTGVFTSRPLNSQITDVQPMTGIVLWENSWNGNAAKANAQLEYAYMPPDSIVTAKDTYDWSGFESFLNRIQNRQHQALVRFYYTYPGRQTAVPQYIKSRSDYNETQGSTEGQNTWFPDWQNAELRRATLAFYTEFANRYDNDPRIAFVQIGFGLWGEYHIYDGPNTVGEQFPSKTFQEEVVNRLSSRLSNLHWSISIDAGDSYYSNFANSAALRANRFGLFDDSFMHETHHQYNESMWNLFGHNDRYKTSPHGGELSYYTDFDQRNVLNPNGIHGRSYEQLSAKFHISYMIGNDQPNYQSAARIKEASLANGYRFEVTRFESSDTHTRGTVFNRGTAPIYYDAFPSVNGLRANTSLKGLLPGESRDFTVARSGASPSFEITCDHLVSGQEIQFIANIN